MISNVLREYSVHSAAGSAVLYCDGGMDHTIYIYSTRIQRTKGEPTMKMLKKDRKQRVSGFTLLEMVVVIAIISILLAVLVPTVRNYLTRSRLHTANSQAKVLFNSMQTIMQ